MEVTREGLQRIGVLGGRQRRQRLWGRFKRGLLAFAPKWGYVLGRRLFHLTLLISSWPKVPLWALVAYLKRQEFCLPTELAPRSVPEGVPKFEIHMMLCEGHVAMAEWAIWSIVRFVDVPHRVVIHDDGSLTASSASRLEALFPQLVVMGRRETDSLATKALENLPLCLEGRTTLDFSLKLFNLECTAGCQSILMLDSDVIMIERPAELLEALARPEDGLRYNEHFREPLETIAEEFRLPGLQARVEKACKARLQPKFNAGVMAFHRNQILDFQQIEHWLGCLKSEHVEIPILSEQSIFAMLAARTGLARPLPPSYRVGTGVSTLRKAGHGIKMFHFMASTKNYFFSLGVPAALRSTTVAAEAVTSHYSPGRETSIAQGERAVG